MEAMECIRGRASVRGFRPDPIPDVVLDEVLEAATAAPSAGNLQSWDFVVVRDPGSRARLAEASMGQGMLAQAPLVVAACSNAERAERYGERGRNLYTIQDAAAATQNLLLAAWAKGIGSCWVGAFDEAEVKGILSLPGHVRPLALVPLGYPAGRPAKPRRLPLSEVVHRERYKG